MDRSLLGKRIKISRKEQGLTAENLAEILSITTSHMQHIEGGSGSPSIEVFVSICDKLHVSPNYLLQDYLGKNELSDFPELAQLLEHATPRQMEMTIAMLITALEHTMTWEKQDEAGTSK